YRDPSRAEVERVFLSPTANRANDRGVVVHRLAHSHEDDIGQRALFVTEVAAGCEELVRDLGFAEVSSAARLSGSAKTATDGQPHLRADADGRSRPRTSRRVVVHDDGFDGPVIAQLEEVFHSLAV